MKKDSSYQTSLNGADFFKPQKQRDILENIAKAMRQEGLQHKNLKRTPLEFEYYPAKDEEIGRFSPNPDFLIFFRDTIIMDEFKHHPSAYVLHEGNFYCKVLCKYQFCEAEHPGMKLVRVFTGGNVPMIPEFLKTLREHNTIGRFHPTVKKGKKHKKMRLLIGQFLDDTLWSILRGSRQMVYRFSQWLKHRRERTKLKDRLPPAINSTYPLYHTQLGGIWRVWGAGGDSSTHTTENTTGADLDYSCLWRFEGWKLFFS